VVLAIRGFDAGLCKLGNRRFLQMDHRHVRIVEYFVITAVAELFDYI
jgi:hypothetical protein